MANEIKGGYNITSGVEHPDLNGNGVLDLTEQQVTDAGNSGEINSDTLFPGGVVDRDETSLTFDDLNNRLTITLTGVEFNFYEVGTKYIKISTETYDIADTEGLHAIYYDGGSLTEIVNPTGAQFKDIIYNKCLIAIVLWNATDKESLLFDERHGCQMPAETHSYLHTTRGCMYKNGLSIGDFVLDQNGNDNEDAQYSISAGQVADEDITVNVSAMVATDTYTVLWKNASGNWRWDTKTNFAVLTAGTGRLAYNNAGTLTEADNNKFVLYHVFGSNVLIDTGTGWENQPLVFMGTAQYNGVSAARDAAGSEIATLDLTGFAYERKALYSLVYETKTGMANGVKGSLRSIDGDPTHPGVDYCTSPLNQNVALSMYHEALLNRDTGDQHTQYPLKTAMAASCAFFAYMGTVNNVTGDGTEYIAAMNLELYDIGGDFDITNYRFTAPVTGKYHFETALRLAGITSVHTAYSLYFRRLNSSDVLQEQYEVNSGNAFNEFPVGGVGALNISGSLDYQLTAGEKMEVSVVATGTAGTKVVDIQGLTKANRFSGYLITM